MNKGQQLRKLQLRINELESENERKDKIITQYRERDEGKIGDFVKNRPSNYTSKPVRI